MKTKSCEYDTNLPVRKGLSEKTELLAGYLCVFGSAFLFYMSTVVIRWSRAGHAIDPACFVFTRFLMGFVIVCAAMMIERKGLRPKRYDLLVSRALANSVAVYCFYKAAEVTTVAAANILNMTYPIFVAVLSWVLLKQERDLRATAMVPVAIAGVWMILVPSNSYPDMDSLLNNGWGLFSGFSAAFAILLLNVSRKYHDTQTILFFMFGLGAVITLAVFPDRISMPAGSGIYYLVACGLLGVGGQYLITFGFRYVTAVEGGILSSTRILLAAILGPFLVSDPPLAVLGWIGALLIFGVNVYLTLRKVNDD